MNPPPLSVLMTVYNGGRYLPETLDSILQQSYRDFELIVIDDCSTDGTWDLLSQMAARDPRVILLRNETNLGITRSMNKLFGLARGTYVTRHDADDLSLPGRFAQQVAFLETHPAVGAVASRVEVMDAEGAPLDPDYFPAVYDNETIQNRLLEGNCLCQGSVMTRRHLLQAVGDYDTSLEPSEDYDLWLRLAEITEFASLATPLYRYRLHLASISYQRRSDQLLHLSQALDKAVHRRYGAQPPADKAALVARQYLQTAVACFDPVAAGGADVSRLSLSRALTLVPDLLAADEPLNGLLNAQMPNESALAFTQAIFSDLLPLTPATRRVKSGWLSQLHMREVFQGVEHGDPQQVQTHLWSGLWHGPHWLLNRGVISLVGRQFLRGRRSGDNGSP